MYLNWVEGRDERVAACLVRLLAGMGHYKGKRKTAGRRQIRNQFNESEIKSMPTLEGSFMSIQDPSTSIPVSGLKNLAYSDVQKLRQTLSERRNRAKEDECLLLGFRIKPV